MPKGNAEAEVEVSGVMGVGDTMSVSLQVEGSQVALGYVLQLAKDSQGTTTQRPWLGQCHCESGCFFLKTNTSANLGLLTTQPLTWSLRPASDTPEDTSDSPFVHQQSPTLSRVHWRIKPQVSNSSAQTPWSQCNLAFWKKHIPSPIPLFISIALSPVVSTCLFLIPL